MVTMYLRARRAGLAIFALLVWFIGPGLASEEEPVRVFFLVGQSNMEGKGDPRHLDTYRDDPLIKPTYALLKHDGQWRVRDDVWITYPTKPGGAKHGPLTVGYGTKGPDSIGPEFGFGHAVGEAIAGPVVLVKIAWGGKSLMVDFRPPGAPPAPTEIDQLWERERRNLPRVTREEVANRFGHYYRLMIEHARRELAELDSRFPHLKSRRVHIAGFVWFQGFNDMINRDLRSRDYADYTQWLIQFIKDVRRDLNAPNMPFVIGELGTGGVPNRGAFQKAQAAVAEYAEFRGNVVFVPTAEFYDTHAHELFEKGYWRGTPEQKAEWEKVGNDRPYHYLGSGKTYYLIGVAFGEAMLRMEAKSAN
ncbi:MAG: sialate O-acetylesterase [Pirellulaceae bacterium]|nr:MAG: sialate O-acetylesterase [Pirellulaceae bacterium]GIW95497.1 MAG: sialate O-acetylesterase [Pirellulaceae bacterium]